MAEEHKYTPIEDYFLIGDLHTAALVSSRASIDWLCLASFDSPSIFAAILDAKRGGRFAVDASAYKATARYIPETAIVETVFESADGAFAVRDSMYPQPVADCDGHIITRVIRAQRGSHDVRLSFDPRPEYARVEAPEIKRHNGSLVVAHDDGALVLHLPEGAHAEPADEGYTVEISLREGDEAVLRLEYVHHGRRSLAAQGGIDFEKETERFWREWVQNGKYFAVSRERMVRSAITLKLMQYYPTGAMIAAPTMGLPEDIGGVRNWDYRYAWIRDATFTSYALYVVGCGAESRRFLEFVSDILSRDAEKGGIKLAYDVRKDNIRDEEELTHLEGYEGSRPVRLGNNADEQFQLDVYGTMINAIYFSWRRGLKVDEAHRNTAVTLADIICSRWLEPDNGIWEIRLGLKHYTYSKVMAWVGLDRAVRMKDALGLDEETAARYERTAREIKDWIFERCFDKRRGTFVQYPGAKHQDATNYLMVPLQFLDKDDPASLRMMEETDKELVRDRAFVYRYRVEDGIEGKEGAFMLASFWRISALGMCGDTERAYNDLRKIEECTADHHLMAEELDPDGCRYLGNFPQAFSHMGYIISVYYIERFKGRS